MVNIMLTRVFRFYLSFSPVKVLCIGPQECCKCCKATEKYFENVNNKKSSTKYSHTYLCLCDCTPAVHPVGQYQLGCINAMLGGKPQACQKRCKCCKVTKNILKIQNFLYMIALPYCVIVSQPSTRYLLGCIHAMIRGYWQACRERINVVRWLNFFHVQISNVVSY